MKVWGEGRRGVCEGRCSVAEEERWLAKRLHRVVEREVACSCFSLTQLQQSVRCTLTRRSERGRGRGRLERKREGGPETVPVESSVRVVDASLSHRVPGVPAKTRKHPPPVSHHTRSAMDCDNINREYQHERIGF